MKLFANIARMGIYFLAPFIIVGYYILFIRTELYESESIILLRDLSSSVSTTSIDSILLPSQSATEQDSAVIEKYITSGMIYKELDKKFKLTKYYQSEEFDHLQRLNPESMLNYFKVTNKNLMRFYLKHLYVIYDATSGTLSISFQHTDAKTAQEVVQFLIEKAEMAINSYDKKNAQKLLQFLKVHEKNKKKTFIDSIKKLIDYQNENKLIDPNIDVQAKSTIIANLESDLIQKQIEYKSKRQYSSPQVLELKMLNDQIQSIKKSITKVKSELSGGRSTKLNKQVFNFEILRSEEELNKEIYKQTLIKLEEAKLQATQNSKNLIVITEPSLPDHFSYPDKAIAIFTLLVVLLLFYGIVSMIIAIVKDHQD